MGGYSWLAAGLRPFTAPMGAVIAAPEVAVAALLIHAGRRNRRNRRNRRDRRPRSDISSAMPVDPVTAIPAGGDHGPGPRQAGAAGVLPWAAILAALTALETANYVSSLRHDHPTLSSLATDAMRSHPGRALLLLAWLVAARLLLLLGRPGTPQRHHPQRPQPRHPQHPQHPQHPPHPQRRQHGQSPRRRSGPT